MGVLTAKEYYGEDDQKTNVPISDGPVNYTKLKYRFLFKPASMGTVNCGFIDRGKEYHFDLVDRVYEVPDELPVHEKMELQQLFVRNGFIDVSQAKDDTEVQDIIKEPEVDKIYVYGHPDNSPDGKVKGNTSIMLESGEEVKLKINNGVVKTDRQEVAQALSVAGWYFVKEIIKEKKDVE